MALETESVAGRLKRICAWSVTPPTASAFMSFVRAIPPRYGQSRSRTTAVSKGRRSLVENTQCIRQELNECMVLSSLRDLNRFGNGLPSAKALGYFREFIETDIQASSQPVNGANVHSVLGFLQFRLFGVPCAVWEERP